MGGASGGQSQSTSQTNPNDAITVSGGTQGSESYTGPQSVWGPQAGHLQNLYGQGEQLMNNFGPYQQQAQNVYNTAMTGFEQMMDPGINPQLEAYQRQVQQNLQDNILPTIQGSAGMAGQMGGSRQGVGEGLALGRGNQQIVDMAANLYNQDMNRTMQSIQMAPGLAQMGMGIPWYAAQQYAGLLGSPTVLGGASSSSSFGDTSTYSRDVGGGSESQSSSWDAEAHYVN